MTTPRQLAARLLDYIMPACERAAIAGSIRRGHTRPHDIEIVLQPTPLIFDAVFHRLEAEGLLRPDPTHPRDGPRYKRRLLEGFPVDLFIVEPPAQWGLTLLIRTGADVFSQAILSRWKRVSNGGFSKGGCLHARNGVRHPTPEEADVFNACRLQWFDPTDRETPAALYITRLRVAP